MRIRSLGYRTDLMIRLLEGSRVEDRGGHLVIRSPHNPTFHWGNFLLLEKPPQADETGTWLAQFAAEFPEAKYIALGIDVTEISGVDVDAFVSAGLRMERSSVMTAQAVHEPPRLYSDATYRELTGDDDWQQAKELRTIASEGEPAADPSFVAAKIASERALTEGDHGFWFGAFVDGKLIAHLGLVTDGSGIARYQNVETHPGWRRKGVAGTLVWRAAEHGLDGMASTLVMVADPDYLAISVYRSVGFIDAETQVGFERQPT